MTASASVWPVLHHTALSVRSAGASQRFYARFGFRPLVTWRSEDGDLSIHQIFNDQGVILELFAYTDNQAVPAPDHAVGNDLPSIGVKHIAFNVTSVDAMHARVVAEAWGDTTDITLGRTGFRYFFVKDPDGNWVEIVEDRRGLSAGR